MSELASAQQEITTKEPKETHLRQQLERLESVSV